MVWRILLTVVCVAAPLGPGLIYWRLRWKQRVREKFAEFCERTVQLSQSLDALKERHKLLPFTDADFATPMTGQTLALYEAVAAALEEYRRRWLDLMSAWEKAEALVAQESWLGASRFREAERTLAAVRLEREVEAVRKKCAEPLDRLEQAHEQATAGLNNADKRAPRLSRRLSEIQGVALPTDPYRPELEALAVLVDQARSLDRADPIAALDCLQQANERAQRWESWIDQILQLRRQSDEALEKLEDASSQMNRRCAEGFLLSEPNSDPRTFLDHGWRQRQTALDALDRGVAEKAANALQDAFQKADEARQLVEKTVAARRTCEEAFALRGDERRRLNDALRQGQSRQRDLEHEFAADSWRDVGDNTERARSLCDRADAALDEAASLATPNIQHYLRAAAIVEQARQQFQEIQTLLSAVERRLNELVELRRKRRDELAELRRRIDRLADSLGRSAADRVRANERCREAARMAAEAHDRSEQPRADWPRLESTLKEIEKLIIEAERLANEDFQLAQQAADEIADAQREIQSASNFHRLDCAADTAAAERSLDEARRKLQSQEYEQAIQLAARAEREARQALSDAQRQADQKQAAMTPLMSPSTPSQETQVV